MAANNATTRASDLLYDGTTCSRHFRSTFILQSTIYGWNANAQLDRLPVFLTGKALRTWERINADAAIDTTTIVQALAALVVALEPNCETLYSQFSNATRRSDESYGKFAYRLQELIIKALPNLPPAERSSMLRMTICNHLPQHLVAYVMVSQDRSYDEIINGLEKMAPLNSKTSPFSSSTTAYTPMIKTEPHVDTNYASSSSNQQQQPSYNNNNRRNHRNQHGQSQQRSNQHQQHRHQQQPHSASNKWCSFHNSSWHDESECRAAQNGQNSNKPTQQHSKPQQGTYMQHNNIKNNDYNGRASTNTASTEDEVYHYFDSSSYSISADLNTNAVTSAAGAELLRVKVRLRLFNQPEQMLTALIDGGSTHSFISPNVLTQDQLKIVSDPSKCQRYNFRINGVTGEKLSSCNVVTADLGLGNWRGRQSFVISGTVTTHQILLGRDWLKLHNVDIKHGSNEVVIGNIRMQVNSLDASTSPLAPLTNSVIVANQQEVLNLLSAISRGVDRLNDSNTTSNDTRTSTIKLSQAATTLVSSINCATVDPISPVCEHTPSVTHIIHANVHTINVTSVTIDPSSPVCDEIPSPAPTIHANVHTVNCNPIDASCFVTTDTIIEPKCQQLVAFTSSAHFDCATVMLESIVNSSSEFIVARSIHDPSSSTFYCNILNPLDERIIISANTQIGRLSEVEEANIQFDKDVLEYVPLNIDKLKQDALSPLSPYIFERLSALKINDNLSSEHRALLQQLISQRISAFQWDKSEIGRTKLVEHRIPTGDHAPIVQRQYPVPQIAQIPLEEQVDEMDGTKVIKPSISSWRSPVLLVKQKLPDGKFKYRFCIDLKKVNAITTKDCYSLPLIHRSADVLSGSNYFTTFDVDKAFWQIGIAEEDKKKTAFVVNSKLYEFNVMPFGSMNAPSTFQRLVDRVLHGLTWRQCLVYIDDVLIFSRTFEEHLMHIDEVLARFQFAGLKLKPSKCIFANPEVTYLGFRITREGLTATEEKLKAVTSLLPPALNKNLYSFLCSINYYRSLIPHFGELTHSLYSMVGTKSKNCEWTPETLRCFEALKRALVIAPILAYPDFDKQFIVHSDASDFAIGSVLLQWHGDLFKPVAFASRRLTETEIGYTVSERELLGITYAYDQFYNYLYGRHVIFYTDHKALVTMRNLRFVNVERKRLDRLFHRLIDVDYELRYIPGSENYLADFLSRAFMVEKLVADTNNIHVQSSTDWLAEQSKDKELVKVINLLKNDVTDNDWLSLTNGQRWLSVRHALYLSTTGILLHSKQRVVCPRQMVDKVMFLFHDTPLAGHRAYETTLEAIKIRYYWINMSSFIKQYCQSCDTCQRFNFSCLHPRAPLQPISVSRPWQLVGVDFMGPFRESQSGNKYIILAIDHFTKFAEAAATISFDALTTAQFLLSSIVCRHGMMEQLLSDHGVNFESNLIKQMCTLLGTKKLFSSTYHQAGNGITERVNKTIKPALAKFVNSDHDDWDSYLPMALSAYNNSYHSTIKMTPFEALYHRPPVQLSDVLLSNQLPSGTIPRSVSDFVIELRERAERINEILTENTKIAQYKQKKQYDKFVRDKVSFKKGDKVKIINYRTHKDHSKGFEPKFNGPYSITNQQGLNYDLNSDSLRDELVHYNRMEKWYSRRAPTANYMLRPPPSPPPSTVILDPFRQQSHSQPPEIVYNPVILQDLRRSARIAATINIRAERSAAARLAEARLDAYLDLVGTFEEPDADDEDFVRTLFDDTIVAALPVVPPTIAGQSDDDTEAAAPDAMVIVTTDGALSRNGKSAVRCERCKGIFEATSGIKIHEASCAKKHRRLSRSSPKKTTGPCATTSTSNP